MKEKTKSVITWCAAGIIAAAAIGGAGALAAEIKTDRDSLAEARLRSEVDPSACVLAFPKLCQSNSAATRLDLYFDKEAFGAAPSGYSWRASILPDGTFQSLGDDYIVPDDGFGDVFPDIPSYLAANSASGSEDGDSLCYFDLAKFASLEWPKLGDLVTDVIPDHKDCVSFAIAYRYGAFSSAYSPVWRSGMAGIGMPASSGDSPTVHYADVYGGVLDEIYAEEGNK